MRNWAHWLLTGIASLCVVSGARAEAQLTARLTSAQEVPSNASPAEGTACLTLTSAGVQYSITVDGLSGPITAAHFHAAQAGVNGGVVRDITADFVGNTAQGIWTSVDAQPLTTARIAELMTGGLYLNVHTAANPGGEIRGQVYLSSGLGLFANLSGNEENPVVASAGIATCAATLTDEGLAYKLTVNGLSGGMTAAHIHGGAIGVNGGPFFDILASFTGPTAMGFIPAATITATQRRALIGGATYVNLHTAANPGGEIRGQLKLNGGFGFSALLSGAQEVPPTGAGELGTASFTLTPVGLRYELTVAGLTGAVTGAHFHRGAVGVNGGVVRDILPDFGGSGTAAGLWRFDDATPLTAALISDLLTGGLYLNVHTAANPGGEIRGQILSNSPNATFTANLTSSQEEPANASTALGTATLQLTAAGLSVRCTVNGLTGAISASHIHSSSGIGINGGVARDLLAFFVGGTATGLWSPADASPFTAARLTELLRGQLYINVHTAANPGGEIRGQILPASGAELCALLTATQEVPPNGSTATGVATARLGPEGLHLSVSAAGLSGAITAAHIHNAQAGVAGGVVRDLGPDFAGTTNANLVWKPSDPSPLSPALVTDLLKGNLYVNLHTAAAPGGEIRGQLRISGGSGFGGFFNESQEVPATGSTALGVLSSSLQDQGLTFRATVTGLTGAIAAAHFHNGAAGVNGPVVRTITGEFVGTTAHGVWKPSDGQALSAALIGQLVQGSIYTNAHTVLFPGGEIRAQLGIRTVSDVADGVRNGWLRLENAPNPFSARTTVSFFLPADSDVSLRVYDAGGRMIETLVKEHRVAGAHSLSFDSSRLANGVYLYRLDAGRYSDVQKMLVVH